MDNFDEYPIILCRYTDKNNKTQIMSGARGDGLCSIWSVLLGWSLLGRSDFIRNKLSNELTFPNNKYTIEIVINSIKKNLGVILAMINASDKQTKDKEITYIPVSEIFNGNFGDQTFTKEECGHTIMQLQKWKKLSSINGSAHLLMLAILLGINIKVRDVSDSNDVRIFSYGDEKNDVVRITTNGAHYNVHNNKKNNNLDHWTMKHWWNNQWGKDTERENRLINFEKPITPLTMKYPDVYGPVNKAGKKKPKKGASIRSKDRKSKDNIRKTPSKMPKVKTTTEQQKIAKSIIDDTKGIRVSDLPGKKADDTTGMRIYSSTPEWAKKERNAAKKIQGLARMNKARKTVKSMKQKEKSRQTRKKLPSIRVGATTPQWYKNQQNAAANKLQHFFRNKKPQKAKKTKKLPSIGIRVSSKPPEDKNPIKAKPPPVPAIPGKSFLTKKRNTMLESDKGKKYTALANKIAETRRRIQKQIKQNKDKPQDPLTNIQRMKKRPQRPFPPPLKGKKAPTAPPKYKRVGLNLEKLDTDVETPNFPQKLSATSSRSSDYDTSMSSNESSGEGKRKRSKKSKQGKKNKKGGTRKAKRKRKTKRMLCFRGSKKNLKKLGKKSKKIKVKLTRRSKKRLKNFKKN